MEIMTDTNMIIKTKLNTYSLVLGLGGGGGVEQRQLQYLPELSNYVLPVINITFPGYISQLICFFHTNRILHQRCKVYCISALFFRF